MIERKAEFTSYDDLIMVYKSKPGWSITEVTEPEVKHKVRAYMHEFFNRFAYGYSGIEENDIKKIAANYLSWPVWYDFSKDAYFVFPMRLDGMVFSNIITLIDPRSCNAPRDYGVAEKDVYNQNPIKALKIES